MVTIKFPPDQAEYMTAILSKVYNIGGDSYSHITDPEGNIHVNIDDEGRKYDAKVFIELENNSVEAYMSIYPAIGSGENLSAEEILEAIAEEGVKINVDEEAVKKAAARHNDNFVVEHVLIAKGVEAHPGKDAVIMVQFGEVDKRPKITADGKVDYKNINNIVHAKKGDILINKRPATMGIRGLTVKHVEIQPTPGRDIEIYQGEGVMLNPLGTQYIAMKDGYVEFINNILAVHELHFINKVVDFSTGNITLSGTVHVKGDVLSGFRVEAKRDVIVDGICEDC